VITLFGMSSPNVLKVMILLEELALPYRFVHVDLFSEGQFDDEFLALNPNAKVPVLVSDEGQSIFESGAILFYLAESHAAFLPVKGAARYETMAWLTLQVATVGPLLGQLNHFTTYAPEGEVYSLGRYTREAGRIYAMIDKRLAESAFLAGPDYSIADIATLPWTDYFERQRLDRSAYPNIQRWRDQLEQRPAVTRARAAMQGIQERDGAMFAVAPESSKRRFIGLEPIT
jgi:GST-like protein